MTAVPQTPAVELLDQLDALRAAATPGPWVDKGYGEFAAPDTCGLPHCAIPLGYVDSDRDLPDAALIVAAVNAVPRLVAALRNVQSRIEDLERSAPDSAYRKVASLLRSDLYATIAAALTDGTPR